MATFGKASYPAGFVEYDVDSLSPLDAEKAYSLLKSESDTLNDLVKPFLASIRSKQRALIIAGYALPVLEAMQPHIVRLFFLLCYHVSSTTFVLRAVPGLVPKLTSFFADSVFDGLLWRLFVSCIALLRTQ